MNFGSMIRAAVLAALGTLVFGWTDGRVVRAADSTVCSVGGDFTSIQAAIDDAGTTSGDTITLCAETFALATPVNVTKSVTIAGQGIGSSIVEPVGVGFFIDTHNVTLRDMTIQNGSQAIRFEDAGNTISNSTIQRVAMVGNSSRGIEVHNDTTVVGLNILESRFDNTSTGLRVSSSAHIQGVDLIDSTFVGNTIGFYVANDGSVSTAVDVLMRGNRFEGHVSGQGTAIFVEELRDALIEDNDFVDNRRDIQIFKWYQANIPVADVVIRNNTMTGTTDAVLAIFNREHPGPVGPGQTEFDGVTFEFNSVTVAGAGSNSSMVYAGAHSGPSAGGIGWDTVAIGCNDFLGGQPGTGVRFFNPGVAPDQVLGGAVLDISENWWGTTDEPTILALMQVPAVTTFVPFLDAPFAEACALQAPVGGFGAGQIVSRPAAPARVDSGAGEGGSSGAWVALALALAGFPLLHFWRRRASVN